jgi:pimeloyl-ACP methyl ester carboxylesterase
MKILFQDKKISYFEKGEGETIVFLHGFMENKNMWHAFTTQLSDNYHVVTIDLPGHGESESLGPVHEMSAMAMVVREVLRNAEVEKCTLVGHSMGGYVSLAFASLFPEMLQGLVLFHSHAAGDTEEGKINRERAIEVIQNNRQNYISSFISDLFAPANKEVFASEIEKLIGEANNMTSNAIIAAQKGMKLREDKTNWLKQTDVPVLFIIGEHDLRIPFDMIMRQAGLPENSETLVLEEAGHMGWLENEQETISAIDNFLMRITK